MFRLQLTSVAHQNTRGDGGASADSEWLHLASGPGLRGRVLRRRWDIRFSKVQKNFACLSFLWVGGRYKSRPGENLLRKSICSTRRFSDLPLT